MNYRITTIPQITEKKQWIYTRVDGKPKNQGSRVSIEEYNRLPIEQLINGLNDDVTVDDILKEVTMLEDNEEAASMFCNEYVEWKHKGCRSQPLRKQKRQKTLMSLNGIQSDRKQPPDIAQYMARIAVGVGMESLLGCVQINMVAAAGSA